MGDLGATWPQRSLLGGLPSASREGLLALGTLREYAAGDHLLTQGDRSRHVYLLVDGWVKVTVDTATGHTSLLAVRVRGDVVGELAGLDGHPRMATVTAVGLVRTRRIGHPQLETFLAAHPDAALAVSRAVSAKLRWASRRRVEFAAFPVAVRVARVLVDLARAYGQVTGTGITIGIELSQPELASLIGASEPSVHRAVRELKQDGLLKVGYRSIVLQDPGLLRITAQLDPADLPETEPETELAGS
jgi:CRP-like cAMP-binding protein